MKILVGFEMTEIEYDMANQLAKSCNLALSDFIKRLISLEADKKIQLKDSAHEN